MRAWDRTWSEEGVRVEAHLAAARRHLTLRAVRLFNSVEALETAVLQELAIVGPGTLWVMKRGRNGGPLTFSLPSEIENTVEAAQHYRELLRAPAFQELVRQAVFRETAARNNMTWPCYAVEEIGFKLSRRGERVRQNQLATFIGVETEKELPNLHLAPENTVVSINRGNSRTVLDYMASEVVWG